jgi:hypothetical protein
MKLLLVPVILFLSLSLQAQRVAKPKQVSSESETYHDYRLKITSPPYGLAKIKVLINQLKLDENDMQALSQKGYQGLSLREKFTYTMINPEAFAQNCDIMPEIKNEQNKIFAHLPVAFSEENYLWSDRQIKFLKANRDSVMALIRESTGRSKRLGANYKEAIVAVNGKEIIPFLIDTYYINKKDLDVLTVLLLLMKQNEYKTFLESTGYKKLYGENSDYNSFILYSQANEELIIKRAKDFYYGGKH